MKKLFILLSVFIQVSCTPGDQKLKALQNRIDSLENKLANTYTPGFGEFMSNIQLHHIKLWFAGKNQNWKLADFEIHEIMESLDDIRKFETGRKESKFTTMLNPALDSVNNAIAEKNEARFRESYVLLTNTCNNCHRDNDFGFNVVKVPETEPFSNQDFLTKPAGVK